MTFKPEAANKKISISIGENARKFHFSLVYKAKGKLSSNIICIDRDNRWKLPYDKAASTILST